MLNKIHLLPEEILSIVLEYKKLSTNMIAKDLDLSNSTISQWKNYANGKFKKVHKLALESIYQIPSDIYDKKFSSEYEVIEYLKRSEKQNNYNEFDDSHILEQLIGKWYCYNYTSSKDLGREYWEDIIEIREDRSVINYNEDGTIYAEGEILINRWQTIITLYRKNTPINIIFDNNLLVNETFFAFLTAKAKHTLNEIVEFVIFTKEKLTPKQVMYALGDRRKNQTIIDEDAKERLRKVIYKDSISVVNRYDSNYILNNHLGTWHINNFSSKKKHTIKINADFSVEWMVDGAVDSVGKLYIHEHDILIILEDSRGIRSYLLLNITEQDIKLCCLKSRAAITHKDIFVVGIMSRDELPKDRVQEILESNEKSYINITYLRDRLSKSMEDS